MNCKVNQQVLIQFLLPIIEHFDHTGPHIEHFDHTGPQIEHFDQTEPSYWTTY